MKMQIIAPQHEVQKQRANVAFGMYLLLLVMCLGAWLQDNATEQLTKKQQQHIIKTSPERFLHQNSF